MLLRPGVCLIATIFLATTLSCDRDALDLMQPAPVAPLVDPRSLLVWRDSSTSGNVRPVFDDQFVYHFNYLHQVAAVDKTTGVLRWKRDLLPKEPYRGGSGLRIAAGVLVVGDRSELVGLDRATGATLWSYSPSVGANPGFVRLTTDGTTVYCGSTTGHVYAVDARTGAEKWAVQVAINTGPVGVYNPVVVDSAVYVGYFIDTGIRGSGGAAGIDARTGRIVWNVRFPDENPSDPAGNFSGVTAVGSLVLAPLGDGSVFAIQRFAGTIVSRIPRSEFDPTPKMEGAEVRELWSSNNVAYLTSQSGYLTALDGSDLHRLWRTNLNRGSPVGLVADSEYVFTNHLGGQVTVSRVSDGSRVWIIDRGTFRSDNLENILGPPAFDGNLLYFGGEKEVYALRRK